MQCKFIQSPPGRTDNKWLRTIDESTSLFCQLSDSQRKLFRHEQMEKCDVNGQAKYVPGESLNAFSQSTRNGFLDFSCSTIRGKTRIRKILKNARSSRLYHVSSERLHDIEEPGPKSMSSLNEIFMVAYMEEEKILQNCCLIADFQIFSGSGTGYFISISALMAVRKVPFG